MKICNENVQDIDAKSPEMSETGNDDVEELHQLYPEKNGEVKMQDNPMRGTRRKLTMGGTFRRKNKRKGNKSAKKQKKTKRRYNKK
jgi:hypothetical protein